MHGVQFLMNTIAFLLLWANTLGLSMGYIISSRGFKRLFSPGHSRPRLAALQPLYCPASEVNHKEDSFRRYLCVR